MSKALTLALIIAFFKICSDTNMQVLPRTAKTYFF
jgi:hypothetical protein